MRIIAYSEKNKILYLLAERGAIIPHGLGGWEVKLLSARPRAEGGFLGRTLSVVESTTQRGTANIVAELDGRQFLVTAGHVVGLPWANLIGRSVFIRRGSAKLKGVVRRQTIVKEYTDSEYLSDIKALEAGRVQLTGENTMDAVLVELLDGRVETIENGEWVGILVAGSVRDKLGIVLPIRNLPFKEIDYAGREAIVEPGDTVWKNGIRTGHTVGVVEAVDAKVVVSYVGGEAVFKDAIIVRGLGKPFSMPGDSGSLVLKGG